MSDTNFGFINPQVRIGHVHLRVADLERALASGALLPPPFEKDRNEPPRPQDRNE
jgi:hypothetical protein